MRSPIFGFLFFNIIKYNECDRNLQKKEKKPSNIYQGFIPNSGDNGCEFH